MCFLCLQVMRESLEALVHQTKSLVMNSHSDQQSTLHTHSQLLLQQQLETLDRARSALQVSCLLSSDNQVRKLHCYCADWWSVCLVLLRIICRTTQSHRWFPNQKCWCRHCPSDLLFCDAEDILQWLQAEVRRDLWAHHASCCTLEAQPQDRCSYLTVWIQFTSVFYVDLCCKVRNVLRLWLWFWLYGFLWKGVIIHTVTTKCSKVAVRFGWEESWQSSVEDNYILYKCYTSQ